MMMTLGFFVFERRTAPYQTLEHDKAWRHPDNPRVGARPLSQFTGVDNEFMTLSGELRPEVTGGRASLNEVTRMADSGKAYPLIDGEGYTYGHFVILDIKETKTEFFKDGAARKIEFSMKLKRTDDKSRNRIGSADLGNLSLSASVLGGLR